MGTYGGVGDKYFLYSGSSSTLPMSLGANGGTLWYSVLTNTIHNWYISGSSYMTLSCTLLSVNNSMHINGATTCVSI